MRVRRVYIIAALLFLPGCSQPETDKGNIKGSEEIKTGIPDGFPYKLNSPDKIIKLPDILQEISGLFWIGNGRLACVQDEKGILFIYSLNEEKIVKELPFWKNGDYEGIAFADSTFYIIRSDGELFYLKEGEKIQSVNTPLNNNCEPEGITFQKDNSRLLIICKGSELGDDKPKPVYAFYMNKNKLDTEPVFEMPSSGNRSIYPSAIAVHPETGETYVLTSKGGKRLLVISPSGKLQHAITLNKKTFSQPEGLAFSPRGTLFIANEAGDGNHGTILIFEIK